MNAVRFSRIYLLLMVFSLLAFSSAPVWAAATKTAKASSHGTHETKLSPNEWEKIVEAAKKEGRLVISGDPSEEWRKSLVDMFREEYPEITVEYTGLNGRNFWPRVRRERELGQKLWDLRTGGVESQAYEAKREGFLDPIRPLLLPEIADNSKWIGGLDGLFFDREKIYMPAYSFTVQKTTAVNRDFIKEAELRSSEQLLNPKFRGRIVMQTPAGGATFSSLGNMAFMYGEKFVRDLLARQNIVVTDDKRQQTEWVVRGKYPIAIGFNETQLMPFVKQGLGKNVVKLEDKMIPVATGLGCVALLKDAPHPNAARVYINWLLSKKTQTRLSANVRINSSRTDVPPAVKQLAVDPAHLANYRFYSTEENVEITDRLLPVINEIIRKKS